LVVGLPRQCSSQPVATSGNFGSLVIGCAEALLSQSKPGIWSSDFLPTTCRKSFSQSEYLYRFIALIHTIVVLELSSTSPLCSASGGQSNNSVVGLGDSEPPCRAWRLTETLHTAIDPVAVNGGKVPLERAPARIRNGRPLTSLKLRRSRGCLV
jgi:hypothetical protein